MLFIGRRGFAVFPIVVGGSSLWQYSAGSGLTPMRFFVSRFIVPTIISGLLFGWLLALAISRGSTGRWIDPLVFRSLSKTDPSCFKSETTF